MQKTCKQCSSEFSVTEDDISFYNKISPSFAAEKHYIPTPQLCPRCRQQRRLAWRNEQHLYRRTCSLCSKSIISVHTPNAPFPVYCIDCWWSDRWNAMDFGIDLDLSKPFLKQFKELQIRTPQPAIQNDNGIGSENSEYCYDISRAKNCYRVIGSWYIEECYYSLNVNRSKFLSDCNTVSIDSELVYESLDSQRLYNCAYLQNCESCSDCYFGYDLKGCQNCLGCYGLRQKRYHIFNKPYTEAEYRSKLAEIDFGSQKAVNQFRAKFDSWAALKPRRAANIQNCEESDGNNLFNCKQVLGYSVFNSEYSKFIDRCDGPKNCYDLINTGGPQWCCDCVTPDDSYAVLFSVWCWKSKNIILSDNCHSSENLFGSIGLKRRQFCILNRQYSKEEYEQKVSQIIRSLIKSDEWGEHLPIWLSPYAYNESAAMEYYPLDSKSVMSNGWKWSNELPETRGKETLAWSEIADNIDNVPDSILDHVLACTSCSKNYKLIASELSLYRKIHVPIPRLCPHCRHLARFKRKTPTEIWTRTCMKCEKEIRTTYSPQTSEIIHCDECYFADIY